MTRIKAEPAAAAQSPSAQSLWAYVGEARPQIERALVDYLPSASYQVHGNFNDALCYALFPGGKRLRPVLTVLGAELVGGASQAIMPAAAAVEYVHTSSLIFDDLPSMDDARERRGRLALHLRFGEGLSVLAALALMNTSYGLLFETGHGEKAIRAHGELIECIGAQGMVAGQAIDLSSARPTTNGNVARPTTLRPVPSDEHSSSKDAEEARRNLKTSALIRFALRSGAMLSGAGEAQLDTLSRFAELLGDAYQTSDDVLDLQEDAVLQNARGSVNLALEFGAEAARRRVGALTAEAKFVLSAQFGDSRAVRVLNELADYVAQRKA